MDNIPIPHQNDFDVASTNPWSDQEISDSVAYWSNSGSFHPDIYDDMAAHLAQMHPGRNRTAEEVQLLFQYVRVFSDIELYVD
jgi:hypothetical protein